MAVETLTDRKNWSKCWDIAKSQSYDNIIICGDFNVDFQAAVHSPLGTQLVSYPAPTTQKAEKGSGQKGRTLVSPRNVIKRLRVRVH